MHVHSYCQIAQHPDRSKNHDQQNHRGKQNQMQVFAAAAPAIDVQEIYKLQNKLGQTQQSNCQVNTGVSIPNRWATPKVAKVNSSEPPYPIK